MPKIRIIIADDHPIFRGGVKEILSKIDEIEIVGEADNGLKAYQLIIATMPDIAILDLEMPMLNGLDVCKKVLNEKHQTEFIILTMHKEKQYFLDAINSGVKGYLLKDNAEIDLVKCVMAVSKKEKYVSQQVKYLLKDNYPESHVPPEIQKINTLLSPTEKIILKLISEGKTSVEIAGLLFVSPNTIDNHRSNMTKKLELEGKNSLLKFSMIYKAEF